MPPFFENAGGQGDQGRCEFDTSGWHCVNATCTSRTMWVASEAGIGDGLSDPFRVQLITLDVAPPTNLPKLELSQGVSPR